MEEKLKEILLTVCNLLSKYKIQYMLVGGAAVALNGYYRHSLSQSGIITDRPDIDIWYNPTYENYFNILKVMEELGHDISEFKNEKTPDPHKSFFKLLRGRFHFNIGGIAFELQQAFRDSHHAVGRAVKDDLCIGAVAGPDELVLLQ